MSVVMDETAIAEVLVLGGASTGLGNLIERSTTVLSSTQVASATYPFSRLGDGRSGRRWIAPTNVEDEELVAQIQALTGGGFNSWVAALPASWTVNVTGTGAVTEETVGANVVTGSGIQLDNGASGTAEALRAENFPTGSKLELRWNGFTSNADSPYTLEVRDFATGQYLTTAGGWSKRQQDCVSGTETTLTAGSLQFQLPDFEETGRRLTTVQVRLHMDTAAASRTHNWDDVFLIPAADFFSFHSHNIEPGLTVVHSGSDEDLSGVPTDHATRFDGSSQVTRSSDFGAVVDNAKFTLDIWFSMRGGDASRRIFFTNGSGRFLVERQVDNTIRVLGQDTGATTKIEITTTATITADNTLHHVLCSVDTALGASSNVLLLDGVQDDNVTVVAGDIDFTTGAWAVGGATDGTNKHLGDIGLIWFNIGTWWDLTSAKNVALFRNSAGKPAYKDDEGRGPLDAPPTFFYRPRALADILENAAGTGDFDTEVGTVTQPIEQLGAVSPTSPAFWCRAAAAVYYRFHRLHFKGKQSGGDENSISGGEWVLGEPKALLKNPNQAEFQKVETLTQNQLETAYVGERWSIKKEQLMRRGYRLRFEQTNEAHALYSEEIWHRAEFGADAVVFVASTKSTDVIHGKVRQVELVTAKQTDQRQATDLDIFENSHGILSA